MSGKGGGPRISSKGKLVLNINIASTDTFNEDTDGKWTDGNFYFNNGTLHYVDKETVNGFFNLGGDIITGLAVVYTIFVVFYILMVVLTGKLWASTPQAPPQQPLRQIHPVARVNVY